jgi:hypothetical protein
LASLSRRKFCPRIDAKKSNFDADLFASIRACRAVACEGWVIRERPCLQIFY